MPLPKIILPIGAVLGKGLPDDEGFKLAVFDTTLPFPQHEKTRDILKAVLATLKRLVNRIEVSAHEIASKRIYPCPGCEQGDGSLPCSVNDIDSPNYQPDDQFIPIYETITSAHAVLFAFTGNAAGIDDRMQRLLGRLMCAQALLPDRKRRVVERAVIGLVTDHLATVGPVMTTLSSIGFTFAVPAFLTNVNMKDGLPDETVDEFASSLVSVVNSLRR